MARQLQWVKTIVRHKCQPMFYNMQKKLNRRYPQFVVLFTMQDFRVSIIIKGLYLVLMNEKASQSVRVNKVYGPSGSEN